MHNLHIINYSDLSISELCLYLEQRHYKQVLSDLELAAKYINDAEQNEHTELTGLIKILFDKLDAEIKQLFVKDNLLLFPHFIKNTHTQINLAPVNAIHQRVMNILQKLRGLLNNYVQQPEWSNAFKICCNELYALEQNMQHILYVKENFLWPKMNKNQSL